MTSQEKQLLEQKLNNGTFYVIWYKIAKDGFPEEEFSLFNNYENAKTFADNLEGYSEILSNLDFDKRIWGDQHPLND